MEDIHFAIFEKLLCIDLIHTLGTFLMSICCYRDYSLEENMRLRLLFITYLITYRRISVPLHHIFGLVGTWKLIGSVIVKFLSGRQVGKFKSIISYIKKI